MQKQNRSLLIVEPNLKLTHPYNSLPSTYHITRVSSIAEAVYFVNESIPRVLMLSASFTHAEQHRLLDSLQSQVHTTLPSLIFVVDFTQKISHIIGVNWAGEAQILSSNSSLDAVREVTVL